MLSIDFGDVESIKAGGISILQILLMGNTEQIVDQVNFIFYLFKPINKIRINWMDAIYNSSITK